MNITALKRIRIERYIFALLMTALMVIIAELSGEKEIIFPEIVALTTGAWIAERQPWTSNKRKMFLLVSLSAFVGVFIVRYLDIPLLGQVLTCFMFTAIALTLTKTTLIPIISACILPVYLRTTTLVYPVSVTIMALIIITAQWIMEKRHLRPRNIYVPVQYNYKNEIKKWGKLLSVLAIIAFIPFKSQNLYFIAPPLIVAFAEFSNVSSPLRKKPLKVFWILVIAALIGTLLREILNEYLHLPLAICAILALSILFIIFDKIHTLFPPAGAILLLPMILKQEDLALFPVQVCVGSFIFIYSAILLFKDKKLKNPNRPVD